MEDPGGESLTESLRNLELPKLDATAIGFDDWLAIIECLMSDISSNSAAWWRMTLAAAVKTYDEWAAASPLRRLKLRTACPVRVLRWPRTEQRGVTIILSAIPEELRREAIATRRLTSCELVYRLGELPMGWVARLEACLEDRLGQNPSSGDDPISSYPLLITNLLTTWVDLLGRIGGGFRW